MVFDQRFGQRDHVLGLGVEEPDGADVILQSLLAERYHRFRCRDFAEQGPGGTVDTDIRGLGGQHHRDQQGVGVDRVEFAAGLGHLFGQPGEEAVDFSGPHPPGAEPAPFTASRGHIIVPR